MSKFLHGHLRWLARRSMTSRMESRSLVSNSSIGIIVDPKPNTSTLVSQEVGKPRCIQQTRLQEFASDKQQNTDLAKPLHKWLLGCYRLLCSGGTEKTAVAAFPAISRKESVVCFFAARFCLCFCRCLGCLCCLCALLVPSSHADSAKLCCSSICFCFGASELLFEGFLVKQNRTKVPAPSCSRIIAAGLFHIAVLHRRTTPLPAICVRSIRRLLPPRRAGNAFYKGLCGHSLLASLAQVPFALPGVLAALLPLLETRSSQLAWLPLPSEL